MKDLQRTPAIYSRNDLLLQILIKKEKNVRVALLSKVGIKKIYRLDLPNTRKRSLQNDNAVII